MNDAPRCRFGVFLAHNRPALRPDLLEHAGLVQPQRHDPGEIRRLRMRRAVASGRQRRRRHETERSPAKVYHLDGVGNILPSNLLTFKSEAVNRSLHHCNHIAG